MIVARVSVRVKFVIITVNCFALEMRQKFDDGEDPLDPEQKAGFQQHPFGGFPFASGQGFTFKFKWS